jgi:hypothetical protein
VYISTRADTAYSPSLRSCASLSSPCLLFSTACCLAVSLVGADPEQDDRDHKALVVLEVESSVKSNNKDKRSPQQGQSQAVFGATPGGFIAGPSSASQDTQLLVPPEYLSLLQQQQQEQQEEGTRTPPQPVLQQLLISRYKWEEKGWQVIDKMPPRHCLSTGLRATELPKVLCRPPQILE